LNLVSVLVLFILPSPLSEFLRVHMNPTLINFMLDRHQTHINQSPV